MVIGDGMIATAFIRSGINTNNQIIFASGVSNSLEDNNEEFLQEEALLLNFTNHREKLVYFSTVSIFDPSLNRSPYILHKIKLEKIIREKFHNYLIIRLPIVVGKSNNPNTLTNFLHLSLINNRPFRLFKNAHRYLIDLDDVVKFTSLILNRTSKNLSINLVLDNKLSVAEIVNMLAEITGKEAKFDLIDSGSDYQIDNTEARSIIGPDLLGVDPIKYNYNLLDKYYGYGQKNVK